MMKKLVGLGYLIAACLSNGIAHGDTSAIDFMNFALASKPAVAGHRTVYTKEQRCRYHHIPINADGGDWEECWDVDVPHTEAITMAAKASSSNIQRVDNLKFDTEHVTSLPSEPILYRQTYRNCGEGTTLNNSITLSIQGVEGYSVQKTHGVSTTVGGSVSMTASYMPGGIGGSGTVSFNMSTTVSASTAITESSSKTTTRSQTWTVSIPPQTMGFVEMLAYQETVDIPFNATIVVDGDLQTNDSGLTKASALLTEAERTLPFDGAVRITNASNGEFRTQQLPGKPTCTGDDKDLVILSGQSVSIPAGTRPSGDYSSAKDFAAILRKPIDGNSSSSATFVQGLPPDLNEQVVYRKDVIRAAPECGFSSDGSTKTGVFAAEGRSFFQSLGGRPLQSNNVVFKLKQCQ